MSEPGGQVKVVAFKSEPREAPVFDRLKPDHNVTLVDQLLRPGNVEHYADAEIISTFIYSELTPDVLGNCRLSAGSGHAPRDSTILIQPIAVNAASPSAMCPRMARAPSAEHMSALLLTT
jgi:hypothetical protein